MLPVRERLLILPIIGVIDPQRARQLTEQLLRGISFQGFQLLLDSFAIVISSLIRAFATRDAPAWRARAGRASLLSGSREPGPTFPNRST